MNKPPVLQPLMRLLTHFGMAAIAFALAWWVWDWSKYDLWMFKIYADLFALGGVIRLWKGLVGLVKFLLDRRQWKKYQAKGKTQKADTTASSEILKKQGLIK